MIENFSKWLAELNAEQGRPAVMGILNVTPDSFSDGGRLTTKDQFCNHLEQMLLDGVDILDIGGESTRPGAESVPLDKELDRVLPAIEWVRQITDKPISIDTYKTEVMRHAIKAGADMVNDVNALQDEGAIELVAGLGVPVCLMHKKGIPKTMQDSVDYQDVTQEVIEFLLERVEVCNKAGIKSEQIVLDPGFGFGKNLQHNKKLFKDIPLIQEHGFPLLVGVSRKRMIAEMLGLSVDSPADARVNGSVAAAVCAAVKGAEIVRVHDVKPTVEALMVAHDLL